MPPVSDMQAGQAYWRSLDELADKPEFRAFLEAEFPGVAPETLSTPSRRRFLKLMGASMALAGMTGCRWPEQKIAPYTRRPMGRTPGVPVQYATAMDLGGSAQGLLVTSYDGRPIKIEGNPSHPLNRGAADAIAQASVLELYDPDRSRTCQRRDNGQTAEQTWEEFEAFAKEHFGALRERGGAGLAVLTELSSSPSLGDMRRRFRAAFPAAKWYEYDPISRDNERRGTAMLFGAPRRPHLALDEARVIVSLDADLLGTHPAALKHARDFAAARDIDEHGKRRDSGGPMCRLYAIESTYTITGAMADHRWAAPSASIAAAACTLARALTKMGLPLPDSLSATLEQPHDAVLDGKAIATMARDLFDNRRHGLVAVGERQPAEVHALVHALNVALENGGYAICYSDEPDPQRPPCMEAIRSIAAEMQEGAVDTLLILGGNAVYDAPDDVAFADGLGKVSTSIHLSVHENETARACTWHLPRAHYLESWGDARAYDGTVSIVQPLIEPLWGGRTPIEVLALVLGEESTRGYDIVRRTLKGLAGAADFEPFWRRCLHDGIVAGTAWPTGTPAPRFGVWIEQLAGLAAEETSSSPEKLEVVFTPDARLYDGRFANNGWLQEMPEPITKLTWDNAALMAPATAEWLGIRPGDLLTLEMNGRRIEIAAFVQPGQAPGSIAISLGFGRRAAGRVGEGVGFDTYRLRTAEAMYVACGAKITRTGRRYQLATTQDHQAMDTAVGRKEGRQRVGRLVREATVDEFRRHPEFARHEVHHLPLVSLWTEHDYEGRRRWAMAIDLNRCIGCGACIVACQAENNIPVVGKDQVARGREMHWIRVDRYYRGEPEAPQVAHQPVTCQQCELAPCEQVCPVAATVHSHEGLNDMVYNRCVGTRYCSNNCPYKVRRFNWFNNHKGLTETEKMLFNPEVTVRARGVMEKCTYCVQRISAARIAAKNERREIRDGEITPACAQTCPAQAIVFGDLSDPESRVSKLHADARSYAMLAELNVKPRTKYLAKLRNPSGGAGTNRRGDMTH